VVVEPEAGLAFETALPIIARRIAVSRHRAPVPTFTAIADVFLHIRLAAVAPAVITVPVTALTCEPALALLAEAGAVRPAGALHVFIATVIHIVGGICTHE
jgi:hypothetical protein